MDEDGWTEGDMNPRPYPRINGRAVVSAPPTTLDKCVQM